MTLKIVKEGEQYYVFDPVRKKYVLLTPEEEVRQRIMQYLSETLQYPLNLMMIEKKITVNKMTRRPDIVVFKESKPYLLVECKAPEVKLTQKMFEQLAQYNLHLGVSLVVLTNGTQTFVCHMENGSGKISFLDAIPAFSENI